jgi:hypothetical protein
MNGSGDNRTNVGSDPGYWPADHFSIRDCVNKAWGETYILFRGI